MDDLDSAWQGKGATLSDKTARKEYGLTQDEIVRAIRSEKLHYRLNGWVPEGQAGEDGTRPHRPRAEAAEDPDRRTGGAQIKADRRLRR